MFKRRGKSLKDGDRIIYSPVHEKSLNCRVTAVKLLLGLLLFGAFVKLLRSQSACDADNSVASASRIRANFIRGWKREVEEDSRYLAVSAINWDEVSRAVDLLDDRNGFQGVGLLNFHESETDQWKHFFPDADRVILNLEYAPSNVTWETLYPEWIDEEQEMEVPMCPTLPKLQFSGKPRLDLLAVKLPCNKMGEWTRDVARLHLQLAAAGHAANSKGLHPMHILFITECFPTPNLFTYKELVVREGNVWLYKPDLNSVREKLNLPIGSCELSVPFKTKEPWHAGNAPREAYATVLHSAQVYVCGAIAAAQSIRMSGSTRDLVILVDNSISDYHREGLEAAGWKIRTIERIRNPKAERDAYNEWNYSKFRLWQLTDYDKIIFIDADLLILRNIDFLFGMPEITAIGNNATLFNSGVMVIEPSNATFELLMDHINEIESYNGGDQGYLNEIFTWWHRIPRHMNFLKHFWVGDPDTLKESKTRLFGADPPVLYVIHYLGLKPWLCFRDYDCNWNVYHLQEFASNVAHKTWWKVHDAMPENLHKYCLLRSKQKAALEWNRMQAEKANYSDGHWRIKIQDPRLNICFEKFCFWESMLWHWGDTNWTDNATATSPPPAVPTASLPSV